MRNAKCEWCALVCCVILHSIHVGNFLPYRMAASCLLPVAAGRRRPQMNHAGLGMRVRMQAFV